MSLFDLMGNGGGLFTPEMKQQAALQGLFAMGSAIGDRSAPRLVGQPVRGANPGLAAIQGYDSFLQNALKFSILGEQAQDQKLKREQAKREQEFYQNIGPRMGEIGNDPQSLGRLMIGSGVPTLAGRGFDMLAKGPETVTAAPGATILDKRTLKPVYTAPEKPPEGMRVTPDGKWEFDTNYVRGRAAIAAAGRPQVTVDNRQENAEAAGYGGDLVKEYTDIRKRADAALDVGAITQIARNIDVKTGKAQEFAQPIAAFAKSVGVNDDVIRALGANPPANAEAFIGTMENLVLAKMQGQAGPQTESDTKRIKATVAQLGNTNEAKEFLLRSAEALAKRDVERRAFYDAYRSQKRTFDGAGEAWRQHVNKTPLVGSNPKSGIPVFFEEFREGVKRANPGATDDAILNLWREKYGGAR